jgi:hypothetical protein
MGTRRRRIVMSDIMLWIADEQVDWQAACQASSDIPCNAATNRYEDHVNL